MMDMNIKMLYGVSLPSDIDVDRDPEDNKQPKETIENNTAKFKRYTPEYAINEEGGFESFVMSQKNYGYYVKHADVQVFLEEIRSTIYNKLYTLYLSDFRCKKELLARLDEAINGEENG